MAVGKWGHNWKKRLENLMLRGYLVPTAYKNEIPTAIPMFSYFSFSMAIIFTSPDIAVILEINMADKKQK